jgi:predicted ArsR family transcriptional regulator
MGTDDQVFKALADPSRRLLLDRLLVRDGQTLGALESELDMTRFGVMKHLRVLEEARPRGHAPVWAGETPFSQPGAGATDSRPVDR